MKNSMHSSSIIRNQEEENPANNVKYITYLYRSVKI